MLNFIVIDRIQFFSIIFSLFIFFFIFGLVKNKRVKEEYSILWFAMSLFLLYLSLDRHAIDRLGNLFGIAYTPSVLTLLTTGFTFLLLIHMTVVVTRLSEQNKELIQELALGRLAAVEKRSEVLVVVPAYNEERNIPRVIEDLAVLEPRSGYPGRQRRLGRRHLAGGPGDGEGAGGRPAEEPRHRRGGADRLQVRRPQRLPGRHPVRRRRPAHCRRDSRNCSMPWRLAGPTW